MKGNAKMLDERDLDDALPPGNDDDAIGEAGTVYILLQRNIPISRSLRLQWLLNNMNKLIGVTRRTNANDIQTSDELEIISIVSHNRRSVCSNVYQVTSNTKVMFLAQSYRFVYCLDMSPSQSSVDIQTGEILFDQVLNCFRNTLNGLCRPFVVPKNPLVWTPTIYVTVIAHTPFFMTPAQQVLVKGVQISLRNVDRVFRTVESQLRYLLLRIARVSALAHDKMDLQKIENEKIVGALFEEQAENEPKLPNIAMVSPDANFVNMLRYSMLALSLLPESSLSHILVITDGVVAMPDVNIMESFVLQQHYDSTAVSFLKVGSSFHPHSSAGYISYTDLLLFLARATKGCCMARFPPVRTQGTDDTSINVYHESFLLWTLHNKSRHGNLAYSLSETSDWLSRNVGFHGQKTPTLLLKKQIEDKMNTNVNILLARRMREGYTIDLIRHHGDVLNIELSLQWKSHIYIQYSLKTQWPPLQNVVHFQVHILAPYEFLHDITCQIKKEQKSAYRQSVIERFWIRLTQLSTGDTHMAQHLSMLQNSNVWYTVPESVKNGIPVFILNNNDPSKVILTASDVSCPKFVSTWQAICQLENNNWRKWFHTQKLSLILKHDQPLPRHLHLANSSGRFQVVQCRQAATALYCMLSDWASFVLIDSHTYLKFLYKDIDKPAVWFCIIRITSKLPCAILNLGFSTETPGKIRHEVCQELKKELSQLLYLSSPLKSKENTCCTLLQKPLEKIHVRYERIPGDFSTVVFPDGTQPLNSPNILPPSPIAGTLFTTLSRYLYHNRWIWSATYAPNPRLKDNAISRILNTITKMRIKEGFSFAHSTAGIINMVLEVQMSPSIDLSERGNSLSCIIQYVLFPPHSSCRPEYRETISGSEDETEAETELESELQIVTEVWIEPQFGFVIPSSPMRAYMDNKPYYELAAAICNVDMKCISTLLTLEHLSLMCQYKDALEICSDHSLSVPMRQSISVSKNKKHSIRKDSKCSLSEFSPSHEDIKYSKERLESEHFLDERIYHVPFKFNPIDLLPICTQTELLFSMFFENDSKCIDVQEKECSNKLLLENFHEHLLNLHDKELTLRSEDSRHFTFLLLSRINEQQSQLYPENGKVDLNVVTSWRCFIKGISITHVILTLVPAKLEDLKCLVRLENSNDRASKRFSLDETPTPSNSPLISDPQNPESRNSNYSDADEYDSMFTNPLVLPVYVYDCPLAVLIHSYVHPFNDAARVDIYEDHRYRSGSYVHEDVVNLKSDEFNVRTSPEPHSDDSDGSDYKSCAKQHCKSLVLAHSKCFVTSLFRSLHCKSFVHNLDVQFAVDQCEETVVDIDITDYMRTVCGHLKTVDVAGNILVLSLNNPSPCQDLKPLHRLIKEKFANITSADFNEIPANREYYYCSTSFTSHKTAGRDQDSDDGNSIPHSEDVDFRSDRGVSVSSQDHMGCCYLSAVPLEFSDVDVNPLFLHLTCSVKYNENVYNTSLNVLPTCLGEVLQIHDLSTQVFDKSKLIQITLDILCLTLPYDVQHVINDCSGKEDRDTSLTSINGVHHQPSSMSSEGSSFEALEYAVAGRLNHLSEIQQRAICTLEEEIKWLLKDEIATFLLDFVPITDETLSFVIKHVTGSSDMQRSSCSMDIVDLHFVYGPKQSHEKFLQEFRMLTIPDYKLCVEGDVFYLSKPCEEVANETNDFSYASLSKNHSACNVYTNEGIADRDENSSQHSDISSAAESILGIEEGYEEDVSEDDDDFEWLKQLDNKRKVLPNFWLIMKVEQDVVTIYFHCRFLELQTTQVNCYLDVQRSAIDAIRNLCKRVNQSLLLQALHDTRSCDRLLEPDDDVLDIWHSDTNTPTITRNTSFIRLKSMDELLDGNESHPPTALLEASLKFVPGYFSCPNVWETPFILHPRLKTGSAKSCLSRGIVALRTVLNKLSVSNRSNMFVYQDSNKNVFYLRLHENLHNCSKLTPSRFEFEHPIVSRSPSITSLPLSQQKIATMQSQQSISSGSDKYLQSDSRPRVRSFGERETKDGPLEDTIILKVHGITEAGPDVKCELVQVLQNRLDDAVLEALSVMLARNSMCKLAPEDVHFLQKPFHPPEMTIRLMIQDHAQAHLDSFVHYLQQNLLQFLNIPKYTDSRSHFHFKDYLKETDQTLLSNRFSEENVFIYNQSQNSGSRGIACISLAIIRTKTHETKVYNYSQLLKENNINGLVSTSQILKDIVPGIYLEFRIWKKGRVNQETLLQKLSAAITHSNWDLIMEYHFLQFPLCTEHGTHETMHGNDTATHDDSKCEQFIPILLHSTLNFTPFVSPKGSNAGKASLPKLFARHRRSNSKKLVNPNSKAVQCLKFDDASTAEQTTNEYSVDNPMQVIKMDLYELGKKGLLDVNYSQLLPNWFMFGIAIGVAAVKRHVVTITSRHNINICVQELHHIISQCSTDTVVKVFTSKLSLGNADVVNDFYIPYESSQIPQKCLLIGRSFHQWKASKTDNNTMEHVDLLAPFSKNEQKFMPTSSDTKFTPRQIFLYAIVQSDKIEIFLYNWSKDAMDKLLKNCTNLGLWLSRRGAVLHSFTAQKLGLFHNQVLDRRDCQLINNPYEMESLMKFPNTFGGSKDWTNRKVMQSTPLAQMSPTEIFRDIRSPKMIRVQKNRNIDPIKIFTLEMQEVKKCDKRQLDEQKKLIGMWQSRATSGNSLATDMIELLNQHGRVIHYCHTPLLFMASWRIQSAATRDHSLSPPPDDDNEDNKSQKSIVIKHWHEVLCVEFINEYKQYLQRLGFVPLQLENSPKKIPRNYEYILCNGTCYIQKSMLGGILIFTIQFNEPFFTTKLHAIELNRLPSKLSRVLINQFQFTLSFLDECDKIKTHMHLHSFTYDFHLRLIHNYIANKPSVPITRRYHLTHFLDDFMKYYSKAPNFARNLVYTDTITIENLLTESKQLYNYLISNVKQYNMDVFEMKEESSDSENEYVLVQLSNTPQVSYKDSQDHPHTDDFNVTLIISYLCTSWESSDKVLNLKYYLILTSQNKFLPKTDNERKLGKFRTVYSIGRSISQLSQDKSLLDISTTNSEINKLLEIKADDLENLEQESSVNVQDDEPCEKCRKSDDVEDRPRSQISQTASHTHSHGEIRHESINYLGYYSSHEQLMQRLILDEAKRAQTQIKDIVEKGMVHCRTSLLWNKLVSQHDHLSFVEFMELREFAKLENLCDLHRNFASLLNQPLTWYQGLWKLLLIKYSDQHRIFQSPDCNNQHLVILHPRYTKSFMLLSTDLHMSRGELYVVYRLPQDLHISDICISDRKELLDSFMNTVCFYLWSEMI